MRSPITFIAAALAALLCAAPALAGKTKRTTTTTTTTTAMATTTTAPTYVHKLALRSDGRIPMGFNGSYPLTTIWSNPTGYSPFVDAHVAAEAAGGASVSRTPLYWNNVE